MSIKLLFSIIWLALAICGGAQDVVTAELARPILDASKKPFPALIKVVVEVPFPPLLLPKSGASSNAIATVSDLLWKRLTALALVVNETNKPEKLETMQAMCLLRDWLLKQDAYTNLLFASYVEHTVSMSILSALSDKFITVDEASQVMGRMKKSVTVSAILTAVERSAPNSTTLRQLKESKDETITIRAVSWRLKQESHELLDTRLKKLIEKERLASLVEYVWFTSSANHLTSLLIEYVAKGGDMNLPYEQLMADVNRLVPEVVGKIDPASGLEIEAAMFGALMQVVREWKSEH